MVKYFTICLMIFIKKFKSITTIKIFIPVTVFYCYKPAKRWVLREWGFGFSLGFSGHFFMRTKFLIRWIFKKFFDYKGVIEKCVGCFHVYPF